MTKVAAYGSLRKGFNNNRLLRNATFVADGYTSKNSFTMRSMGGFPAVYENGNNRIRVEVYEVDDPDLAILDMLEGHPNWYERQIVDVQTDSGEKEQAYMYIMPQSERDTILPVIPSGDWANQHEG